MIELVNVSKYYPTDFGRHYVFRDVNLVIPLDKSVGVLGPNGAGKSTFLRLLGGADIPSEGAIYKTGRISPPMGLTPGLQAALTAAENARFAGRIYGMSRDEINAMIDYVRELSDIGKYFDMPVGTYSAGMKQRVGFAINMSMDFDYYLFDEIGAGGDKEFRKSTKSLVQKRLQTSKFIIASHRIDELLDICDAGIVIRGGELTYFENIRDALKAYGEDDDSLNQKIERKAKKRARRSAREAAHEPGADAAPAEAAALSEDKGEDARARRRKRRAKSADAAPAAADQTSAASPDSASPTRRRKRRAKSADAAPAAAEPAAASPDSASPTRRRKRRAKSADAAPAAAEQTSTARRRRRSGAADSGTPPVAAPVPARAAPAPSSRRRRRAATPAAATPAAATAAAEPVTTAASAADARAGEQSGRRKERRKRRHAGDAAPAPVRTPEPPAASPLPAAARPLRRRRTPAGMSNPI